MATTKVDKREYRLTLSLSVLDDLGRNLYSSIPAVLSEAVANAWDADANAVAITFNFSKGTITILDDGMGMDYNEVNDKYLTVGYHRRENKSVLTPAKRHPMGRKGIGKLSLFAIADRIEIQTVKLDKNQKIADRNGFVMRTADVAKNAKAGKVYNPIALDPANVTLTRGTRIVLSALTRTPTAPTIPALRKRLARRFSVIGAQHNFEVLIDGKPIGVTDRDYFDQLQYLWSIGEVGDTYDKLAANAEKKITLAGAIEYGGKTYSVSGWVGTFQHQRSLNPEEGDNTVSVLAWGKVLHEDLLPEIKKAGIFTKYLIGEIRADFLDLDDQRDIATSDRQHVQEDDPRFQALSGWFRASVLGPVENAWGAWRADSALEDALKIPSIRDWHDQLSKDHRRFAKQLFAKIGRLHAADIETRAELYRNAILAFERLKLKEALSDIDKLPEQPDFETLSAIFQGIDEIEAAEYHRITTTRVEVIRTLAKLVDQNEKERVIQEYLFDHLWLLDSSWERASTKPRVEQRVSKEFDKVTAKLSAEEQKARLDIRYKSAAGKHIIVELKRSSVSVNVHDLLKQLDKYRSALEKCLEKYFPDEPKEIETVAVVGKKPTGGGVDDQMRVAHARYVTYDGLIGASLEAYRDYTTADEKVAGLNAILSNIEDELHKLADSQA